jgi:hypothetical protein
MPGPDSQQRSNADALDTHNEDRLCVSASFNEGKTMMGHGIGLPDATEPDNTQPMSEPLHRLRLLLVMARGRSGEVPEAWQSYARIEDARTSALKALRNSQVLSVAIVEDGSGSTDPLRFVEWVGR